MEGRKGVKEISTYYHVTIVKVFVAHLTPHSDSHKADANKNEGAERAVWAMTEDFRTELIFTLWTNMVRYSTHP